MQHDVVAFLHQGAGGGKAKAIGGTGDEDAAHGVSFRGGVEGVSQAAFVGLLNAGVGVWVPVLPGEDPWEFTDRDISGCGAGLRLMNFPAR